MKANWVKISVAAKEPDAPPLKTIKKQCLHKVSPKFLKRDGKHWAINVNSPLWAAYKIKMKVTPKIPRVRIPVEDVRENKEWDQEKEIEKAAKAALEKKIHEARLAKIKADQEEVKLGEMLKRYTDVDTMNYYLSFMQRGISDSFSVVKRIMPEVKWLCNKNKDHEAENVMIQALKKSFENVVKNLNGELEEDTKKISEQSSVNE